MGVFEFDEVFPDVAPRAGADEFATGFAEVPFGMIFLKGRAPAGVVDDDVEEEPSAALVDAVGEFAELVNGGGVLVELDERGIDAGEFLTGVGTAETAEAREGRGRGRDRKQMENAAAERAEDVGEFAREVAEFSRGRDDGVAVLVEELEALFEMVVSGFRSRFTRAEHAREGAVNGVRRAIGIRVYGDAEVRTAGPELAAEGVERVRLGAEVADFGERNGGGPAVVFPAHRHVVPRSASERRGMKMGADDFLAQQRGAAEVGAQARLPALVGREVGAAAAEGELRGVADVAEEARAGGRGDGGLIHEREKLGRGLGSGSGGRVIRDS